MPDLLNHIGGKMQPPSTGDWLDVFEPATGSVYARLANSGKADIDAAVQAATAAHTDWSDRPAEERAMRLNALADVIEANLDRLAEAESLDNGKPVSVARSVDIPRAVSNFRFFASTASQFSSESHAMGPAGVNYTLRQSLGAVACISPWNLPLYLLTWKIAPALAAGNTVVAKPSEVTPLTASLLGEMARDSGLPDGVLNIVHGRGRSAGAALVQHSLIRAVSFTGSTATGAAIANSVASDFKKLSLEMGGKNPTIVFADCELDRTVEEVCRSAFANQGQICLCGSRILVEASIYEEFRDRLVQRVSQLRVGDPNDSDTQQGAVVSEDHYRKVLSHLELAREEGGTVLCGGKAAHPGGRCKKGWFIEPTLIEGLANRCRTNQEEIFGPVATLQPFGGEAEAIALANDSRYGLAASIWSQDIGRCHRVASKLEAGIIWVNCWMVRDLRTPFGGMKSSGVGREGGLEALRFFTEPKNVCVNYDHE